MAQKINKALKIYHKAFCETHFIQVFFLSVICSIYIIFLWALSDVKEKLKRHYCVSNLQAKCTGFMQTWTLSTQYPDIAFSYGNLGNVKPL